MPTPYLKRILDAELDPNIHGELTEGLQGRFSKYYSDGDICKLGTVGAALTSMTKMLFGYDLVERAPNCPIVSFSGATE